MKIKQKDLYTDLFIICIMLYYALRRSVIYRESFKIILLLGILIGFFKILKTMKFNKSQLLKIVLFSFAIISLYFILNNISLLIILFGMIICSDINIYHLLKVSVIYKLIFTFLFWLLRIYNRGNVLGIEIGIVVLLFIAMKNGRLAIKEVIWIVSLIIIGVYMSNGSGSFIAIMALALFFIFFLGKRIVQRILETVFVRYIFPICFFLNVFFALCVNESSMPWIGKYFPETINNFFIWLAGLLDLTMSYRLSLSKVSLEQFGVKWIGKTIDASVFATDLNSYFYLDSGYLNMVQGWGILFVIVIMIFFVYIMTYLVKNKAYGLVIAGICIAFWGINEPILTYIDWNFLLLIGGEFLLTGTNFSIEGRFKKEKELLYEYS